MTTAISRSVPARYVADRGCASTSREPQRGFLVARGAARTANCSPARSTVARGSAQRFRHHAGSRSAPALEATTTWRPSSSVVDRRATRLAARPAGRHEEQRAETRAGALRPNAPPGHTEQHAMKTPCQLEDRSRQGHAVKTGDWAVTTPEVISSGSAYLRRSASISATAALTSAAASSVPFHGDEHLGGIGARRALGLPPAPASRAHDAGVVDEDHLALGWARGRPSRDP